MAAWVPRVVVRATSRIVRPVHFSSCTSLVFIMDGCDERIPVWLYFVVASSQRIFLCAFLVRLCSRVHVTKCLDIFAEILRTWTSTGCNSAWKASLFSACCRSCHWRTLRPAWFQADAHQHQVALLRVFFMDAQAELIPECISV